LRVSRELRRLRETFRASYPRVRIEDLLQDVDEWCGFTRAFQPLGGYAAAHARDTYRSLLAALIAHGTNLGLAAMSQSVDDLTAEMLQDTTRWFLRDETLKAANAILVDYHHHLPLSRVWGDGSRSSSDGQRFAVQRDSLLGSVYPRYFGYYDRALAFYTHTADQHSVYATQVIACTPREAGYVLAGILENDSVLPIREHTSDTHGFTEHLFGLCALLGIQFMPRLKDLSDQVLSGIDRAADYGPLQPLFRNFVNLDLIAEQWDELVRLAASLKDRLSPAHVVMQRLINAPAADRLASALSHLGRLVKTIHIYVTWNQPCSIIGRFGRKHDLSRVAARSLASTGRRAAGTRLAEHASRPGPCAPHHRRLRARPVRISRVQHGLGGRPAGGRARPRRPLRPPSDRASIATRGR
jgi:TnpA family transposase